MTTVEMSIQQYIDYLPTDWAKARVQLNREKVDGVFIPFDYVDAFEGDYEAAAGLAQVLYWADISIKKKSPRMNHLYKGHLWKVSTYKDIQAELHLEKERSARTVIDKLSAHDLIIKERHKSQYHDMLVVLFIRPNWGSIENFLGRQAVISSLSRSPELTFLVNPELAQIVEPEQANFVNPFITESNAKTKPESKDLRPATQAAARALQTDALMEGHDQVKTDGQEQSVLSIGQSVVSKKEKPPSVGFPQKSEAAAPKPKYKVGQWVTRFDAATGETNLAPAQITQIELRSDNGFDYLVKGDDFEAWFYGDFLQPAKAPRQWKQPRAWLYALGVVIFNYDEPSQEHDFPDGAYPRLAKIEKTLRGVFNDAALEEDRDALKNVLAAFVAHYNRTKKQPNGQSLAVPKDGLKLYEAIREWLATRPALHNPTAPRKTLPEMEAERKAAMQGRTGRQV